MLQNLAARRSLENRRASIHTNVSKPFAPCGVNYQSESNHIHKKKHTSLYYYNIIFIFPSFFLSFRAKMHRWPDKVSRERIHYGRNLDLYLVVSCFFYSYWIIIIIHFEGGYSCIEALGSVIRSIEHVRGVCVCVKKLTNPSTHTHILLEKVKCFWYIRDYIAHTYGLNNI